MHPTITELSALRTRLELDQSKPVPVQERCTGLGAQSSAQTEHCAAP